MEITKQSIRQEKFTQFWMNAKHFDFYFAEEFLDDQGGEDIIFIKSKIYRTGSIASNGLEFSLDGDYLPDIDATL